MATVKRRGAGWQATVRVNGRERTKTLRTRAQAETWAAEQKVAVTRGTWIDPRESRVSLESFATKWLEGRHDLAVRTAELYEHLLERHISPTFGDTPLSRIRGLGRALVACRYRARASDDGSEGVSVAQPDLPGGRDRQAAR